MKINILLLLLLLYCSRSISSREAISCTYFIRERWCEHFKSVMNTITNEDDEIYVDPIPEDEDDITLNDITLDEIKSVIRKLKNGKAPGMDGITGEMLKTDIDVSSQSLMTLFNEIWRNERIMGDWKLAFW